MLELAKIDEREEIAQAVIAAPQFLIHRIGERGDYGATLGVRIKIPPVL